MSVDWGMIKMDCPKCKGAKWLLYDKDAPSPPYKENQKLTYGLLCECAKKND